SIAKNLKYKDMGKKFLTLKQFMLRQDVLKLYRDVYRMTRSIADQRQKNEIRSWAASEIRTHRNHQDEVTIRGLIIHGQRMLKDLEKSLKVTT
ncbi:hypothetical protein QYM36_007110, partial [Artemia franciscana]